MKQAVVLFKDCRLMMWEDGSILIEHQEERSIEFTIKDLHDIIDIYNKEIMSEHIDVNVHMSDKMLLKESDAILLERAKESYEKLKHDIQELNQLERKIRSDYTSDLNRITLARKNLQDSCPHLEVKHYPDPSGNNDSHDTCQLCNKDI